MDIFEKAAKGKLRFAYRGQISAEDLWDLSLSQLDSIYAALMQEQRSKAQDSLLNRQSGDEKLQTKIEIVRHIVQQKLLEKEKQADRLQKAQEKQRLLEILESKKDAQLSELSVEELTARINAIE